MTFSLDGVVEGDFVKDAPRTQIYTTAFAKENLTPEEHTLVIQSGRRGGKHEQVMMFLNSIIYTKNSCLPKPSPLEPNPLTAGLAVRKPQRRAHNYNRCKYLRSHWWHCNWPRCTLLIPLHQAAIVFHVTSLLHALTPVSTFSSTTTTATHTPFIAYDTRKEPSPPSIVSLAILDEKILPAPQAGSSAVDPPQTRTATNRETSLESQLEADMDPLSAVLERSDHVGQHTQRAAPQQYSQAFTAISDESGITFVSYPGFTLTPFVMYT